MVKYEEASGVFLTVAAMLLNSAIFPFCLSSAKKKEKEIVISLKAHVLQEHHNTYANKHMCCNLSPTTQQKCLH